MAQGTEVNAVMGSAKFGTGLVSRPGEDANGKPLVWVNINGTEYPFYPHELTPVSR